MNLVAHNVASKLFVGFVAVAMLFTLATPAKAATAEELQQMINQLLAQVASLQGQLGQGGASVAAGVCPYTWTRSLSQGSTGADVMKLQQFLNADAETRVAASGVGSAGMETEFFGPATAAAVSKFQVKYRSDVLSPSGLVNPTGFFGPASMAKANALCASAPVVVPPPTTGTGSTGTGTGSTLSGGEASLEDFSFKSGDETDLREGQSNAPVADIEFDVEDGDIQINRVDLVFEHTGSNSESDPWDTFSDISLWVDGDKVAEVRADSRNNWSRNTPTSGKHRIRMTGLDLVFRDGETAVITVGVSVQGTVRGITSSVSSDWKVSVADEGIRGRDGAGLDQYIGSVSEFSTFTIEEEGADDEIRVRTSSADPKSTTIELEDDTRSGWINAFTFNLDTRDSTNDIEILSIPLDFSFATSGNPSANASVFLDNIRLVSGGKTFTKYTLSGNTATFTFDDEFFIDAGKAQDVRVEVRFKALASANEGATMTTSVTGSAISAEGATNVSTLGGSATSEIHTLRTEGVTVKLTSSSQTSVSPSQTANDTYGEFKLRVEVTAIGDEMVVYETGVRDVASGMTATSGVGFTVRDGNGNATSSGAATVSFTRISGGTKVTGADAYRISDGSSAVFEVVVTFNPVVGGQYRVQLEGLGFLKPGMTISDYEVEELNPASDFRSGNLFIAS